MAAAHGVAVAYLHATLHTTLQHDARAHKIPQHAAVAATHSSGARHDDGTASGSGPAGGPRIWRLPPSTLPGRRRGLVPRASPPRCDGLRAREATAAVVPASLRQPAGRPGHAGLRVCRRLPGASPKAAPRGRHAAFRLGGLPHPHVESQAAAAALAGRHAPLRPAPRQRARAAHDQGPAGHGQGDRAPAQRPPGNGHPLPPMRGHRELQERSYASPRARHRRA
mmetsp:Transcript_8379/g.21362  ORF Transcript_8379/g.21362 Transcript_8379/m.21362 type:complete len:224 (+) Transcript_8379:20-691(+)